MTNEQLEAQNRTLFALCERLRAHLDFLRYGLDIEIG
jgi:hypothetical protein